MLKATKKRPLPCNFTESCTFFGIANANAPPCNKAEKEKSRKYQYQPDFANRTVTQKQQVKDSSAKNATPGRNIDNGRISVIAKRELHHIEFHNYGFLTIGNC